MIRSDYLAFGGSEVADFLDLEGTLSFLRERGFGDSQLSESRHALQERRHDTFTFETYGSGYCDFCYAQLMGVNLRNSKINVRDAPVARAQSSVVKTPSGTSSNA